MKYFTAVIIAFTVITVGLVWLIPGEKQVESVSGSNVEIIDGVQYITVSAKGGYSPKASVAAAGMPTILQVETQGTFDCSSSLLIPALDINENLPATGITEVDLGTPEAGVLEGTCSMGMYRFDINFQA